MRSVFFTLQSPGQLLARAQTGGHAEWVERERLPQPALQLLQRVGAGEF